MGRTNPTFRDALRALEDRWHQYRRGLRRESQARFDRLFEYARAHADAAGYLNPAEPVRPVLFSIDLEQERRIDEVADRVANVESRLEEVEGRLGEEEDRPGEDEGRLGEEEDRPGEDADPVADSGDDRGGDEPGEPGGDGGGG